MTEHTMWMVRAGEGGHRADEFRERGIVAIGWNEVGDASRDAAKPELLKRFEHVYPEWTEGRRKAGASQLVRFRDEVKVGDSVITYDSSRRVYHVGTITGHHTHDPDNATGYDNTRSVEWRGTVERDGLSVSTRNQLGSTLTLFRIGEGAAGEVEALLGGGEPLVADAAILSEEGETEADLLRRYKKEAFEILKDRANRLDADAMERLVAGLLRAMGYQTRQSPTGPDRGVDVLASPDGFGFEQPRIVVEVKHRRSMAMGAEAIRSFLGGRHADDKGLYVSTGGFTREARYEAERAKIPLTLMDLDELIEALTAHYETADWETQGLMPMTRVYWPVV